MAIRTLRATLLTISCVGMLCLPVLGTDPDGETVGKKKPAMALDVALDSRGMLAGELRNRQGQRQVRTELTLWRNAQLLQRTKTDDRGRFRFSALRVGVYRIVSEGLNVRCRAWTGKVAPPSARPRLLLVTNEESARGQQPLKEVFVANPFLMGTVIAAAIAIPIAVHNSGDDDHPDGS